jgi:hypothetical protein
MREQELQQLLAKARLQPETNVKHARLYRAVKHITDVGSVFYVLWETPGQQEDYFSILVDDKAVVDFALQRHDPEALPEEVEQYSIEEYRKSGDEVTRAKLRIALELARRDLGR